MTNLGNNSGILVSSSELPYSDICDSSEVGVDCSLTVSKVGQDDQI